MRANEKGKKKRSSGLWKFTMIVCAIVGSFLLVATVAIFGYLQTSPDGKTETISENGKISNMNNPTKPGGFMTELFLPPQKTSFIIMGVDELEALTDVILVGSFDRDTKKVSLISIPRDTYVVMDKADIQTLKDLGRKPPVSGIMKINAVHSYAGKEHGAEYLIKEVEDLFDIKIDYYAEVNLKAFKNIVDAVGGIEMEIPKGGLHYRDPIQGLVINVPGGLQVLDGQKAEGVVRFRDTYARGDLQRIEVQQAFMKEFFKQVLNKETIVNNAASFLGTMINHVKTNFGVQDIPMYLKYINGLSGENFETYTLPGEPETINGASYFIHDQEETAKLVHDVLIAVAEEAVPTQEELQPTERPIPANVNVKALKMQVLNGGKTTGMAGQVSDKLKEEGYNVINVGNYTGTQKNQTRIMVRQEGIATELLPYFSDAVEEVDEDVPVGYDVIIIIGIGER